MKLRAFLQRLSPRFERRDIQKTISNLHDEVSQYTLPAYQSAETYLSGWDFKAPFCSEFDKLFQREIKPRQRGNYVETIHDAMCVFNENLDALSKIVDKLFARDVIKSSLSYSKVQVLQSIDAMAFVVSYSRKLLIHTLNLETAHYRGNNTRGQVTLSPADVQFLESYRMQFLALFKVLSQPSREIEKKINTIPDIVASEDNMDLVAQSTGLSKLDPMGYTASGFIPTVSYYIGSLIAERQHARYQAAQEEKKLLEYQLMDLENALENANDPKIQKMIEMTQNSIDKLNAKIRKFEESAGV